MTDRATRKYVRQLTRARTTLLTDLTVNASIGNTAIVDNLWRELDRINTELERTRTSHTADDIPPIIQLAGAQIEHGGHMMVDGLEARIGFQRE